MKKELSMLAMAAAMLSAGTAKGSKPDLVKDVFEAPIDQILSVSDNSIVTYRPTASHVVEKDGKTTTNYYPTVAISADGTRGFAYMGPKPVGSSLLVNEETGKFVVGSEGLSEEFAVGQLREGTETLSSVSMQTYKLQSNQFSDQVHKMKNTVGYMYDENHVILFGEAGVFGNNKEVTRAIKDTSTNGVFVVSQYTKTSAGMPKMATQTSTEVFTSDGTEVSAYNRNNVMDKTVTSVVSNTEIKGMEVMDDTLLYATTDSVRDRSGSTVLSLDGITGMAKVGSTIYVATANAAPQEIVTKSAKAPTSVSKIVPVYGAKQIISGKENGKEVLWKLTMNNKLERVNN